MSFLDEVIRQAVEDKKAERPAVASSPPIDPAAEGTATAERQALIDQSWREAARRARGEKLKPAADPDGRADAFRRAREA
jgi:hypothetical protein